LGHPIAPDSDCLLPIKNASPTKLINALTNPKETRLAKKDSDGTRPATTAWTHRYKEAGQPPKYELYDQIWISPSLQNKLKGAWIDRRRNHGGDGSDHDPAWIELDF